MKLTRPTILIIEDNPVDARLVQDILSSSKAFETLEASSLQEGLTILSGNTPVDAILLDLSLPDSQGLNTLEEVSLKAEHIPIVILTSLDNEDTGLKALQKGAQDYLIKGEITAHLLVRAIRYAIERKQAEQKLNDAIDLNKKIFSASAIGILTYKSSGQCNYANDTAGKILNATVAQLLEQNFHKIESWKNSCLYDYAREVLTTKQPKQQQFNFISTFGKNVWVDCSLATYTSNKEEYLLIIFRDISRKKFAEDALLYSKSQLSEAMDIAQLFHWEYNVTTGMFHFDEKVNTFLGRNASSTDQNQISIEDYLEKYVFPEDREIVLREIEKTRIKADPDYFSQVEYRLIGADKVIRHVMVRIRVTINSGVPKRYYGIIQDITHQKQVENDLQEYRDHLEKLVESRTMEIELVKRRMELLLESVGEGIYGLDTTGHITFINPAAIQMMGTDKSLVLGKNQQEIIKITRSDGSESTPGVLLTLKDGVARRVMDELFWRKDNSFFPVEYVCTPVMESGSMVGFVVVFNDITKRRLAELELKRSEKRYRMLADSVSDMIWNINLECEITYISPSVYRQTGFTSSEAIQAGIDRLFSSESAVVIRQEIKKAVEVSPKNHEGKMELLQNKNDGSSFWTEVSYNILFDQDNRPGGLLCVSRDISERKKLIQELQEAKIAAESATRIKSEFLANMSHEIRTPLNAIMGFSDMLCTTVSDHKQQSQVQAIHSSAKSLMSLINDILDLSKIEAGKLTIEYQPINLSSLIKDIQLIFAQKMQEKGLAFFIDMDYQIPGSLMLDEIRLRQIFFNVIGNAVKFTENGYISINIGVKSRADSRIDLLISIEDTGIGIAADQQEKIFEAFQQQEGQNIKKYGGTGLGLTITKRLVEMMNGSLTVRSVPGEGSTFEILLPDIQVSDKQIPAESFFDYESVLFEPATILICDDDQANRKLIKDLLEKSSLNIIEAEDGKEALDFARKHRPAIILMDLKMPKISGIEVAGMLKKDKETKKIPIIALSGSSKTILKEEESKDLFESFLLKPLKIEVFFDQLKKYLLLREMKEKEVITETEYTNLTDDQLKDLPILTDLLEREYLPLYHQVLQNQRIDQIEFFGESLVKSGFEFSIKILENFGQKVRSYADSFEIDKLLTTLHEFPEVIQKIKTLERIK